MRYRHLSSVRGGIPVRSEADLHLEGHREIGSVPHAGGNDRSELVELIVEYDFFDLPPPSLNGSQKERAALRAKSQAWLATETKLSEARP